MAKTDEVKTQTQEQEIKNLRAKIARLEAEKKPVMVNALDGIMSEIKKIKQKGKGSPDTINVVERHDHKNISLWTKWGKRIGPMHPDNAIQTLQRFAEIGIILSADRPTKAQLEAYKETAEYKDMIAKEQKRRAIKNESRKSGQMEKLTAEIAKLAGVSAAQINHILKPNEVGK